MSITAREELVLQSPKKSRNQLLFLLVFKTLTIGALGDDSGVVEITTWFQANWFAA